uniref:Uncharacterized protein n=1 Tax=Arundo donax TaxID=35708 RepID=A0A0A9SDX5_ARUDO
MSCLIISAIRFVVPCRIWGASIGECVLHHFDVGLRGYRPLLSCATCGYIDSFPGMY